MDQGPTVDDALEIKNTDIVKELSLPPVKIHCSVLAEDAIRAAIGDWKKKNGVAETADGCRDRSALRGFPFPQRVAAKSRPLRRGTGDEKASMSNMVTIESKPAEGAFAAQPQPAAPQRPQPRRGGQGLQVTERAIKRIRVAMAKEGVSPEEGGLRLGVMGGGCSGLSYSIKFDTRPRERDRIYEFDGVRVFVDPKSFLYLHGMTLDYEETLMRQGFNFINPNSSRSCGCGSSFSS